ncbi:alpha-tocopherol transfer protein-like [Plodia interpunctella]|uniref:alpha-tocopherol transfer protein-like n=1 Tax=Plodia interpunctella TaxID=58824 RepID=UPI002367EA61|nr:alpha-tocopherol transfer protein-like [Plodia interpunctella]
MSTASVLLTVGTTWGICSEKADKGRGRNGQNLGTIVLETSKELRETPAGREQALDIMRKWIQKNGDIRNVRQDDNFLLRFLRVKKYSIPLAQQTLLKYLNLKRFYPEVGQHLDWKEDKNLYQLINTGYIAISPVRDSKGRRVIIYNMNKFKPEHMTSWDLVRAHTVVYESLLEDPSVQVCGVTHVGDGSGVTTGHVTAWNPTDFARIMKWSEESLPMRHKAFHLLNVPTAFKYIIDFVMSRASPKMSPRVHIHSSTNELNVNYDAACVPTEFGGEIPLQDMIAYTKQILEEHRDTVVALDKMEILSTRGIITSRNKGDTKDGVSTEGSFRKLEID